MPKHRLVTPEEWYRLTGERGSVYIGPPTKRPKPSQQRTKPKVRQGGIIWPWDEEYDPEGPKI